MNIKCVIIIKVVLNVMFTTLCLTLKAFYYFTFSLSAFEKIEFI